MRKTRCEKWAGEVRAAGACTAHSADRRGQSATLRFDLAVGLAHRRPPGMDPRGSHWKSPRQALIWPTRIPHSSIHQSIATPAIAASQLELVLSLSTLSVLPGASLFVHDCLETPPATSIRRRQPVGVMSTSWPPGLPPQIRSCPCSADAMLETPRGVVASLPATWHRRRAQAFFPAAGETGNVTANLRLKELKQLGIRSWLRTYSYDSCKSSGRQRPSLPPPHLLLVLKTPKANKMSRRRTSPILPSTPCQAVKTVVVHPPSTPRSQT